MNILLIGGTGFIGQALTHYFLSNADHFIVSVGRSDSGVDSNNLRKFNIEKTGWEDIIGFLKARERWVIIDLAYSSVPNTSFEDPVTDFSENLKLVNQHLHYIKDISVSRYIYVSSGGTVYGAGVHELHKEEDNNFPYSPYGITKMASERYVYMHYIHYDLHVNIVRPSNVYGPGQRPFRGQGFIATAFASVLKNNQVQIFGNGMTVRDYIYIDDFCTAMSDVIHFGSPGGIYNIGSGIGYSLNDLLDQMGAVLEAEGHKLSIVYQPMRKFDVPRNILDNSKLKKLNGWSAAMPIEDGLKQTWYWIKKQPI